MWVALLLLLMMAGSAMCEIVELTQECSYNYRNYTVTGTVGTEIGVKIEPDRGEAKPETQRITGTGTYGTATFRWGTSTAHGSLDEYIITVYNTSDPSGFGTKFMYTSACANVAPHHPSLPGTPLFGCCAPQA